MPLIPPFALDRATGNMKLATDETIEVTKGTNLLATRLSKLLRKTADGIDLRLGKTISGKSGELEMVPSARIANLDSGATLAQTIAKLNELLEARRAAGEQMP